MTPFRYMLENRAEVLQFTIEHLILVGVSMALALALGIPLGVVMTRHERMSRPILTFANLMQTIPSLALFGFLIGIPFIGIGARNAVVALLLYALLPIIRNTYTGITHVDASIREAAIGMGMTDWQRLKRVEIPLAMGVIFAGIRVATVISVGLATIAAAIGAGGLGTYIFRGVSTVNSELILAGAIPAAVIALTADFILGRLERYWSRHRQRATGSRD
jgi:osmoprotectant transport system permease protein